MYIYLYICIYIFHSNDNNRNGSSNFFNQVTAMRHFIPSNGIDGIYIWISIHAYTCMYDQHWFQKLYNDHL